MSVGLKATFVASAESKVTRLLPTGSAFVAPAPCRTACCYCTDDPSNACQTFMMSRSGSSGSSGVQCVQRAQLTAPILNSVGLPNRNGQAPVRRGCAAQCAPAAAQTAACSAAPPPLRPHVRTLLSAPAAASEAAMQHDDMVSAAGRTQERCLVLQQWRDAIIRNAFDQTSHRRHTKSWGCARKMEQTLRLQHTASVMSKDL